MTIRYYKIDTVVLLQKMAMTEDSFLNYPVEKNFSRKLFCFVDFSHFPLILYMYSSCS